MPRSSGPEPRYARAVAARPHPLFASIVLGGITIGGCYSAHERIAVDAGRDATPTDAPVDGGSDGGCAALACVEPCDERPECSAWPCTTNCIL